MDNKPNKQCRDCYGKGRIVIGITGLGELLESIPCPFCDGLGYKPSHVTVKSDVKNVNGEVKSNVNSRINAAKYKKLKAIANLRGLGPTEVLSILPIKGEKEDYVVPIRLAAKIKGVSRQAIYLAIEKGKMTRYDGVLLSELLATNNANNNSNGDEKDD